VNEITQLISLFWKNVVPSLIEGLRIVQGLREVPVFVYRYSIIN